MILLSKHILSRIKLGNLLNLFKNMDSWSYGNNFLGTLEGLRITHGRQAVGVQWNFIGLDVLMVCVSAALSRLISLCLSKLQPIRNRQNLQIRAPARI